MAVKSRVAIMKKKKKEKQTEKSNSKEAKQKVVGEEWSKMFLVKGRQGLDVSVELVEEQGAFNWLPNDMRSILYHELHVKLENEVSHKIHKSTVKGWFGGRR